MKKQEFIEKLISEKVVNKKIELVEKKYSCKLPDDVKKLLSIENINFSIDEEKRILPMNNILNANKEYDYDFINNKIIPLIDCSDNDLLVYNIAKNNYSKFNIVNKLLFREKKTLIDNI